MSAIIEEIQVLNILDHPNIVNHMETYDDVNLVFIGKFCILFTQLIAFHSWGANVGDLKSAFNLCVVMEFIDGKPLFDEIISQKDQAFGEKRAIEYMKQLFQAINHCHANGVIHRDIKPENIMLVNNDKIKLIDFGLSKIHNDT
jgi:serine/threonine protein kinase